MLFLQVTLTDYEHSVLLNLRDCVFSNYSEDAPTSTSSEARTDMEIQQQHPKSTYSKADSGLQNPEPVDIRTDKADGQQQSHAWDVVCIFLSYFRALEQI